MPESVETNLQVVRPVTKKYDASGLKVSQEAGKFVVEVPGGATDAQANLAHVEVAVNSPGNKLSTISPESATLMVDSIQPYTEKQEYTDLIMYGPPQEGSVQDRMARLKEVRDFVTKCQQTTLKGEWKDRPGLVNAATFVRSQLPNLGLQTTINTLRAIEASTDESSPGKKQIFSNH